MRFLIDVDGVVADLFTSLMKAVKREFGSEIKLSYESTRDFYFYDNLPPEQRESVIRELAKPGFAKYLGVVDGALEGVEKILRAGHEIFWLTAPCDDSITWVYDRNNWLKENFNASTKNIIYAHSKFVCCGDVLIDDKIENVSLWQEENPQGLGIIYDRPWNESDENHIRFTWKDIDDLLARLGGD